jgi:hypothetical protein
MPAPAGIGRFDMRKIAIFAALTVALFVTAAIVRADQELNIWFPVNTPQTNPCNGETVDFTGKFHMTVSETFDSSGTAHIDVHDNSAQITRVGETTGAKYSASQVDNFTFNPADATEEGHFTMIGQGGVPNFTVYYLFHITVNANGVITVIIDNFGT